MIKKLVRTRSVYSYLYYSILSFKDFEITKPEITKKISTPIYPFAKIFAK